jgi:CRISPR system Cascade subunit CasC
MILELHAIQSFPPANLNRDDTGAPKDCVFGGVRRARVSSQSFKRAMRMRFADTGRTVGLRTKRVVDRLEQAIAERDAALASRARELAASLLAADPLNLKVDEGGVTAQLLFWRPNELDALADVCVDDVESLEAGPPSAEARKRVANLLTRGGSGLDVALFGRMIAEMPEGNVDAACHVAHAIGTHRLAAEFDYYTAVDDLRPEETEGADMIGAIQYNATCLYRYARLDSHQLAENLALKPADGEIGSSAAALSEAFVTAIPGGKQATFAAYNPPSAVVIVRRATGSWNLANAFLDPVAAGAGVDLAAASTERLVRHLAELRSVYGRVEEEIRVTALALGGGSLDEEAVDERASTLDELLSAVRAEAVAV